MPLSKLFKKRHSLKNTKSSEVTVSNNCEDPNKELCEVSSAIKNEAVEIDDNKPSEESTVNVEFVPVEETSVNINVERNESKSAAESHIISPDNNVSTEDGERKTNFSEFDDVKRNVPSDAGTRTFEGPSDCKETSQPAIRADVRFAASCSDSITSVGGQANLPANGTSALKINRSTSLPDGGTESNLPKFKRKKCDSESAADDEGFEEKVIHLREKDLERVIGQYVNNFIRESIVSVMRNVTVENLHKEVVEAIISSPRESEGAPAVEQKLLELTQMPKDGLSEKQIVLEGENAAAGTEELSAGKTILPSLESIDGNVPNQVQLFNTHAGSDANISENGSFDATDDCQPNYTDEGVIEWDPKEVSIGGYQADMEESVSVHSVASESSCDDLLDSIIASGIVKKDSISYEEQENENTSEYCLANSRNISKEEDAENTTTFVSSNDVKDSAGESPLDCVANAEMVAKLNPSELEVTTGDLMAMSEDEIPPQQRSDFTEASQKDLGENLPERQQSTEEEKKINWKVGYLHVKLPHKSRGQLKVWKKRCVAIQPDEFVNDPQNPSLMISVYSGDSGVARKHGACFWKSVSGQRAVVYRSSSRTHPYAFTVSEDRKAVVHLSSDSEAASQEWMAAIRAILWPPSPVMQLEKMLNSSSQFEIAIIDNDFSYHAGLLGMYGYLTITQKKLILVHPQQGYVIQEWYLNTVDKFQLMPQTRIEDAHKVLAMTTCSDSSTGKGDLLMFCCEAVTLLQSLASTIHQVLTYHSNQEGGKYQKELEEVAEWLTTEDYYKVPPRQVKSLLDIPNFIFNKPLSPVATVAGTKGVAMDALKPIEEESKTSPTRTSQDSGISAETCADDFLNCSLTSFVIGGGPFPGKSSDSELSDAYTPPQSPQIQAKHHGGRIATEHTTSSKT